MYEAVAKGDIERLRDLLSKGTATCWKDDVRAGAACLQPYPECGSLPCLALLLTMAIEGRAALS